jgi:cyclopropane-fatty-acyl-phospholipid synthase
LFLDSNKQYSRAYFENDRCSLEKAQQAKMRHIAAKLLLNDAPLRVLDIGSGCAGLGGLRRDERGCFRAERGPSRAD